MLLSVGQWMIHDWSDDESLRILKRCKDGLKQGKGSKVIIIDIVMEYHERGAESVETQLFFDMLMMVLVTGKERSEGEWAKLFEEAGFREYKITPMLGLRSVIEVYPWVPSVSTLDMDISCSTVCQLLFVISVYAVLPPDNIRKWDWIVRLGRSLNMFWTLQIESNSSVIDQYLREYRQLLMNRASYNNSSLIFPG